MPRQRQRTVWLVVMIAAVAFSWSQARASQQSTPPPTQNPPVPRPFPGATPPATPPSKPAEPSGTPATPTKMPQPPAPAQADPDLGGTPIYPGADYLGAFDAGRSQRYHLYGTNAPYAEIVIYYKNALKRGGSEISRTPAIQQFELGRFDDETMAFPPSVVVKDYTWNNSPGYLHVVGTTEKRYRTIIQIVPPGPGK
jgi:hypothetical protein